MDIEVVSDAFEPDSHFLFWKPGTAAVPEPADMAWRLDPSTDLILNMHLQPSGRPERIQPSIGLYFTDTPPIRTPMLLQLEHDGALDIPAGRARVRGDATSWSCQSTCRCSASTRTPTIWERWSRAPRGCRTARRGG